MQKEVITTVTTNYKFLLEGTSANIKFELAENTYFIYTPFKINNYSFRIIDKTSFSIGCERVYISELKSVLNRIKGNEWSFETYMVDKYDDKLFKKEDILEESENYYIVGTNVFEKSSVHGEKEFPTVYNLVKKYINAYGKSVWCYKGHPLGKNDDIVIQKLEYILNVLEKYKEALNLHK